MRHFNNQSGGDIELSFSTLSFYDEVVGHVDKEMETLYFDMMPYSPEGMTFNTGLFTSRPNLKAAIRTASKVLHAANKLYVSKIIGQERHKEEAEVYLRSSQILEEAISSAQSPDIITGACRTAIAESTIEQLRLLIDENMARMSTIIDDATFYITGIQAKDSTWDWCQLQNASYPGGVHWKCPTRAD